MLGEMEDYQSYVYNRIRRQVPTNIMIVEPTEVVVVDVTPLICWYRYAAPITKDSPTLNSD